MGLLPQTRKTQTQMYDKQLNQSSGGIQRWRIEYIFSGVDRCDEDESAQTTGIQRGRVNGKSTDKEEPLSHVDTSNQNSRTAATGVAATETAVTGSEQPEQQQQDQQHLEQQQQEQQQHRSIVVARELDTLIIIFNVSFGKIRLPK
ncbi:hypothetical protein PoB_003674000 [Plakobranchus ocellatus]|uniref:Uncharacterized protein n=1 Tax=Plakobranchus ocellatus TaxID=259542 RepID=A0AAV4ASF5_9GAST|nr:hypothetical protein PoB_003674000 [Plakobranchus ocellatus]